MTEVKIEIPGLKLCLKAPWYVSIRCLLDSAMYFIDEKIEFVGDPSDPGGYN